MTKARLIARILRRLRRARLIRARESEVAGGWKLELFVL